VSFPRVNTGSSQLSMVNILQITILLEYMFYDTPELLHRQTSYRQCLFSQNHC
jgi:hypothetical protein